MAGTSLAIVTAFAAGLDLATFVVVARIDGALASILAAAAFLGCGVTLGWMLWSYAHADDDWHAGFDAGWAAHEDDLRDRIEAEFTEATR